MAESERVLLNHYNLPSLDLETWPVEHDVSSSDEDQGSPRTATANLVRRSRSRYSILDRSASYRSSVLSAEKSGVGNLVQKDEPDPLGDSASVVQALRQRGLPVEEDLKLSACDKYIFGLSNQLIRARESIPPIIDHVLAGFVPSSGA